MLEESFTDHMLGTVRIIRRNITLVDEEEMNIFPWEFRLSQYFIHRSGCRAAGETDGARMADREGVPYLFEQYFESPLRKSFLRSRIDMYVIRHTVIVTFRPFYGN